MQERKGGKGALSHLESSPGQQAFEALLFISLELKFFFHPYHVFISN